MAQVAAMRQMYQRLGFTEAAANSILNAQGVRTLDDLCDLDETRCANLCKNLRRPGGTIPNPATQGNNAAPPNIPNPGHAIPEAAEHNLTMAVYFLNHRKRVSRPVQPGDVTLVSIRALRELKRAEDNHENPTKLPKIDPNDWPRTIEGIQDYFRRYLGSTGIPLAYVTRPDQAVTLAALDTTTYVTPRDEMIARAPHYAANGYTPLPTCLEDRAKVWELMVQICANRTDCWVYIEPGQARLDGRTAFRRLYNNYLGPNKVDNQAAAAETKLASTTYTGEKKRWNFDKYVQVHIAQHSILSGLEQHGYKGIDDRSRVRLLMAGIKTSALDPVTTRIMSSPELRQDFDACVTLYRDFLQRQEGQRGANASLNIARVSTSSEKGGNATVEDRYYTREEYAKLSPAQKLALKRKRESRGARGKGRDPKRQKRTNTAYEVKQLAAVVARLKKKHGGGKTAESDGEESTDEKKKENPALTRQRPRGSQA